MKGGRERGTVGRSQREGRREGGSVKHVLTLTETMSWIIRAISADMQKRYAEMQLVLVGVITRHYFDFEI